MSSQPVTFPCPFCSRRMGVPAELLGRQVRCPHCKQVVVAPVTAGTPTATAVSDPPPQPVPAPVPVPVPVPVAVVPPPAPAPLPATEPELRPFNIPQKEGADSILSAPDESDDEVFGSQPGVRMNALPPLEQTQPTRVPAPVLDDPFGFGPPRTAPAPVPGPAAPPEVTATAFDLPPNIAPPRQPAPPPAPAPIPSAVPPNPFADMEPVAVAPVVPQKPAPVPQPVPVPVPQPAPRPVAAAAPTGGNPFADFDAPPAPVPVLAPVPVPVPVKAARPAPTATDEIPEEEPPRKRKRDDDAEPEEKPARAGRGRAAAASGSGGGLKTILLVVMAGYAFLATAIAVYGLFFKSGDTVGTEHPLSTIPDSFGEFDPVSRKKVTQFKFPVNGELPDRQRAALGGKLTIGQLEVQPVRVQKRALLIKVEGTDEKEKKQTYKTSPALVLTLDIKNTSDDLSIHPLDPAFTRRATKTDQPITRLMVGQKAYFGGEIEWPLPARFKKKQEVQQANDATPLRPGESREYVVFTEASLDLVRFAEASKEPLQWRVQVRRGLIDYKGKEVPVTAVIGVDFKGGEIRPPD